MRRFFVVCLIALSASCAQKLTRLEVIDTAYRYTQVRWMPEERNIRHGPDSQGIIVHTPDSSITAHGGTRGWWQPGQPAVSMPYQWGGFDTPESFVKKIAAGKKAGDVADAAKRKSGDAGVSQESCGIDCSGFVSRCWKLSRPYSTRELPTICDPLSSYDELLPGDILLNDKHVVIFARWITPGFEMGGYEAGPIPAWKVSSCGLPCEKMIREKYKPWRYRLIEKP